RPRRCSASRGCWCCDGTSAASASSRRRQPGDARPSGGAQRYVSRRKQVKGNAPPRTGHELAAEPDPLRRGGGGGRGGTRRSRAARSSAASRIQSGEGAEGGRGGETRRSVSPHTLRPEEPVAEVAEAGQDVLAVVEGAIEGGGEDHGVGHDRGQVG